jgi:anti-sigma regulatory factor (Ser/Thr protein kinase)
MSYLKRDENDVAMKKSFEVSNEDFASAGTASSKIKKILRQIGIESAVIRRVAIATYEAEINVAIHSLGGDIDVLIKSDRVEIYVEDKGPGIEDLDLAMQKGYSTATKEIRELGFGAGMGLPNMEKCSDIFHIESDLGVYTGIKMTFNI